MRLSVLGRPRMKSFLAKIFATSKPHVEPTPVGDEIDEIIRRLYEANRKLIPGICFGKAARQSDS